MSASRTTTLNAHFTSLGHNLRPILTSLNGDNSWLISFPLPVKERKATNRAYYHAVLDPWLVGPSVTLSSWLVSLSLTTQSVANDGNGIEALARDIEDEAATAGLIVNQPRGTSSYLDAIFIGFHYTDHMHKPTLCTFDKTIPVFAVSEAAGTIRTWDHFRTVIVTHDLDSANGNWHEFHPGAPLPNWLNIFRIIGHHELNFADIIVWSSDEGTNEAILYSPHGIRIDQPSFQTYLHKANPPVSTVAMLHALKDSFALGARTTLGVAGGLALEAELKPAYWIKTHDSTLLYNGLFSLVIRDVFRSMESGIEELQRKSDKAPEDLKKPNLIEIESGECFVLS